MIKCIVIGNLRGACASVKMLKGYIQTRRQDLAAGGPKTRRVATFSKNTIGCVQQPGAKREMGDTDFKWGGRVPPAPPLATALGTCSSVGMLKGRMIRARLGTPALYSN